MSRTHKKLQKNKQPHGKLVPPKPPSRFLWLMEAIFISLTVFAVLSLIIVLYLAATNHRKAQNAVKIVTDIIPTQKAEEDYKKIYSYLGFEITVNTKLQTAETTSLAGDKTSIGSSAQPTTKGDYKTVEVSKNIPNQSAGSDAEIALKKTIYIELSAASEANIFEILKTKYGESTGQLALAEKFYAPSGDNSKTYTLTQTESINIAGYEFLKNTYDVNNLGPITYKSSQVDYITIQNGRPYRLTLFQNAGSTPQDLPSFNSVIESIKFFPPENSKALTQHTTSSYLSKSSPSPILSSFIANAADKPISSDPEIQVVAKNQPSVVRIASTYCIDFDMRLGSVTQSINGGCSAGYGSGFIISPQGYVGTNGHVVKSNAAEVLATSLALNNLPVVKSYLSFLARTGLITQATADSEYAIAASGDGSNTQALLGSLQDSELANVDIKETKQDAFYAVQLSDQAVKFNIDNLRQFKYTNSIVKAKLVAVDYDPYVDIANDGFKTSDVAILKLESGDDYPYSILGSIKGLAQGSPLTVIGFPGAAENELVDSNESKPTPTRGTVSAIRSANGAPNKLIQSDVSIAKGNSGGPAFNEFGEVVGIATYGVTDENSGGVQFNYMRDIEDLRSLLADNNISVPSTATGNEKIWEQGLENFSKAYYTSAISDFSKLKLRYPPHRMVDDFIARAEASRDQGKEATPSSVYILIVAVVAFIIVLPSGILFFVIRHHNARKDAHEAFHAQAVPAAANMASLPPLPAAEKIQGTPNAINNPTSAAINTTSVPIEVDRPIQAAADDNHNNQAPTTTPGP